MAPELRYTNQYDEKVDVYSFGVIVWALVKGRQPDFGFANAYQIQQYAYTQPDRMIPWLLNHLRDSTDEKVIFEELISKCIKYDPNERPGFYEIIQDYLI